MADKRPPRSGEPTVVDYGHERDVPLDDATIVAAEGMCAHLRVLAQNNTHVRGMFCAPTCNNLVPNEFQRQILELLDGRAMKVQAIADDICGSERSRLYKPGGLRELKSAGLVAHKHRLGYYRPDAPPTEQVCREATTK